MSRRESYSDTFTGRLDQNIRELLEENDTSEGAKLRRILLKIIKNELTPRQREIIMLYYFKSMDIASIASELDISPQSVSATMSRARLRIFRILQYYF
ncbi:MAG: sigma-70 region 4 domain-containing protein [Ruminococcus sp.]|nr:sigma-70 region 4 domain-containing protein [Ruminococcus sp.]